MTAAEFAPRGTSRPVSASGLGPSDYDAEVEHPLLWSGIASGVAVPLLAGGQPVGTLTVHQYERREFTDAEVSLLERAATQVGPALQTMGLLALAGRRTAEAEALGNLLRTGSRVVEDEEVAALICEHAARLLAADVAGVVLRELRPADGAGLEEMFLELTAETAREGAAA